MKVWGIVKSGLIWLYEVARVAFLMLTGMVILFGGILAFPRVYDFVEKAKASWQPATSVPDCWFNWFAPIAYDCIPRAFIILCFVWFVVFMVKGFKSPGVKEVEDRK